jgi:hypothetical protein
MTTDRSSSAAAPARATGDIGFFKILSRSASPRGSLHRGRHRSASALLRVRFDARSGGSWPARQHRLVDEIGAGVRKSRKEGRRATRPLSAVGGARLRAGARRGGACRRSAGVGDGGRARWPKLRPTRTGRLVGSRGFRQLVHRRCRPGCALPAHRPVARSSAARGGRPDMAQAGGFDPASRRGAGQPTVGASRAPPRTSRTPELGLQRARERPRPSYVQVSAGESQRGRAADRLVESKPPSAAADGGALTSVVDQVAAAHVQAAVDAGRRSPSFSDGDTEASASAPRDWAARSVKSAWYGAPPLPR